MRPMTPEEVAEYNRAQQAEMEQHIYLREIPPGRDLKREACLKWIDEYADAWRKAWLERHKEKP